MAFTYEVVTIGSQPYAVYGDVVSARLYLQADMTSQATSWLAASATTQARSLVAAVRWLDQQNWVGTPTDLVTPQALQWPRINVLDQFGQPVASDSIPANVQFAEFELAAVLVANIDARADMQALTPRSLGAGSARIEYFGPRQVQLLTPFPQNIMDLIGLWLLGQGVTSLILAKGYSCKSPFDDDIGFNFGL